MKFIPILLACMLVACTSKTSETTSSADSTVSVDNTTIEQADTEMPRSLIIHGKDIWVRDEPRTGKVIMKLNEGDQCKIIGDGRFDVIKGKGNLWYNIEFEGKQGWVFGSQTDQEGMEWSNPGCSNAMGELYNKIIAIEPSSSLNELWSKFGQALKATEYSSDNGEGGEDSRTVEIKDQEISSQEFVGGANISQIFKRGSEGESIAFLPYDYTMGAAGMSYCDGSLVAMKKDSGWVFLNDIKGKVYRTFHFQNDDMIIVSSARMGGSPGYNMEDYEISYYQAAKQKLELIQTVGFSLEGYVQGAPDDWRSEDGQIKGSLGVEFDIEISKSGETPQLQISEKYAGVDRTINRILSWNADKKLFE